MIKSVSARAVWKELRRPRTRLLQMRRQGAARAVFVDRDGVLNDLVYDSEEGRVVSPFSAEQLRVFPYAPAAIRAIREELGFKVVVISNQPGVAKRQFTLAEHGKMNAKVRKALRKGGAVLDGEYYCLHHPDGVLRKYRANCDCRKPKPGLLLRAAEEMGLDLARSYFVGDGIVDVKAGKSAGCKTVLLGHMNTTLSRLIEQEGAKPDYMVHSLKDVPGLLRSIEKGRAQ